METYQDFLQRINSFEKEELYIGDGHFTVNPSLHAKVTQEGYFRDFFGDTVVFNIDKTVRENFSQAAQMLHRNTPECFSVSLISDTFHITLHDLSNSPELGNISEEMFFNELRAVEIFRNITSQKIRMKNHYIFNMVNTSIVSGLYPTDETEYLKLMNLYCLFDKVKPLPYPFTPHITLAYYNPVGFSRDSALKLKETVYRLNEKSFEFELDTRQLYYQKFTNMNNYINIIGLQSLPEIL